MIATGRVHRTVTQGIYMNQKKLRRLYREEGLQVRKRGGRKRALSQVKTGWPDAPESPAGSNRYGWPDVIGIRRLTGDFPKKTDRENYLPIREFF
jgi:hypothetical protein